MAYTQFITRLGSGTRHIVEAATSKSKAVSPTRCTVTHSSSLTTPGASGKKEDKIDVASGHVNARVLVREYKSESQRKEISVSYNYELRFDYPKPEEPPKTDLANAYKPETFKKEMFAALENKEVEQNDGLLTNYDDPDVASDKTLEQKIKATFEKLTALTKHINHLDKQFHAIRSHNCTNKIKIRLQIINAIRAQYQQLTNLNDELKNSEPKSEHCQFISLTCGFFRNLIRWRENEYGHYKAFLTWGNMPHSSLRTELDSGANYVGWLERYLEKLNYKYSGSIPEKIPVSTQNVIMKDSHSK